MLTKQKGYNLYIYFIVLLFGFKNLISSTNNQIDGCTTFRFLLYRFLTKLINSIQRFRNKIDIRADKVHFIKLSQESEQAIIIDKDMFDDKDFITFEDIIIKMDLLRMDGTMTNLMIVNLDLINGDDKICLKNHMFKYKDTNEQHHHTLKNIFIFNNIQHDENSSINIKIFKDKKLIAKTILLKDVINQHINQLIST